MIGLSIPTNLKDKNYDFIQVIVYLLTKIVYFEPVNFIIDVSRLAKVILDVILYHGLLNLIISNRRLLLIS